MARTVFEKMGKVTVRLVVVIDTLKSLEYITIDSPKVNPSAASGLVQSEERNGSQLTTLLVSGEKSDGPLSPDYTPSIFSFTDCPLKRKSKQELSVYERRKNTKKTRHINTTDNTVKFPFGMAPQGVNTWFYYTGNCCLALTF